MNLIKALYDPQVPLPKDFYEQLLEELEYFSVSSQIYVLLKQQGKLEQTPQFFQERLKEKYIKVLYQNIFIKNQTEQILTHFETQGIDVIPLKGTVFAEKYFGHIGARPTSDIDVLIKAAEVEKAIECVKSLGFDAEKERIPGHFHCSYSKEIPRSRIPLSVEFIGIY
ncbi:nucleotidyltransferase family protein [Bacillus sp. V33-4]|uniref:nucleotidyltransferase family protein n=1 Tax=Bacillus sp. V33-4 TaxID=2054169 RepID=UPI0021557A94|nr:nucleotidyltransferase family protein [Bacillus sp. V33-4]